ncbi:DUF6436 domain-containing protein [uncultured Thalassolituus sp.]|uniref:DUF6436 domain-containing protein n=1 Tax=uncultured Thalassolituus sp. TaxID=285273 RepID=UPI00261F1C5D|nr:DUF6436 domain-containing protein [uncultured Thalassolituus sp.]
MQSESHSNTRVYLVSLLIIVWIGASLGGLWWFQQQATRPFADTTDHPDSRNGKVIKAAFEDFATRYPPSTAMGQQQAVTLYHLWNPDCLCNNVSQRHINRILSEIPEDKLRFIMLAPADTTDEVLNKAREATPRAEVIRLPADTIPLSASPGLAILGPDNHLAYYGAYGFGALCSLSDDKLFTNMISTLLSGESYGPFINIAGSGCFCAWPDPQRKPPELTGK